jgi:molecular chaperone GrpE
LTDQDKKTGPETPHSADLQEHAPSQLEVVGDESEEETEVPIEDPLEKAITDAAEYRDKWLRAIADFDNYRKRVANEKSALLKYKNEDLLRDILGILDNLERALQHVGPDSKDDPVVQGVSMVTGMFGNVLDKHGVKPIQAKGQQFDPRYHEAIARVPAPEGKDNEIIEEFEKGYMYLDRLLRPAKVVVAIKAQPEQE